MLVPCIVLVEFVHCSVNHVKAKTGSRHWTYTYMAWASHMFFDLSTYFRMSLIPVPPCATMFWERTWPKIWPDLFRVSNLTLFLIINTCDPHVDFPVAPKWFVIFCLIHIRSHTTKSFLAGHSNRLL